VAFPTGLTSAVDSVTDITAALLNNVEAKIGIDSSAVTTSHDYKLSGVTGTDKAVSKAGTETLTNKTLTSPVINTPTGDVATLTGSETLTNKTLTKPTVNGSISAFTTDTDAATVTFDLAASNVHSVTLGGNRTLALSNASVGQMFAIRLIQDGTGSRTVTWFTTLKWADSGAPTLTTAASKIDTFVFICTSSGNYEGYIVGQNVG